MSLLGRLVTGLRSSRSAAAGRVAALRACQRATELLQRGDEARAGEQFSEALRHDAACFAAHSGIGVLHYRRGDRARALHHLGRALEIQPQSREIALLAAQLLRRAARPREALAVLAPLRVTRPQDPLIGFEHARLLRETGDLDAAREQFEALCALRPDDLAAAEQLAMVYRGCGEIARALEIYARLSAARPGHAQAASAQLFNELYRAHDRAALFARHVGWGRRFASAELAAGGHANLRDAERVLRIGYVSSDFGRTSAASFIEPLLARHDPGRFAVYCYHASERDDEVTRRFRSLAQAWREVAALDDAALCAQVRQDAIDVLVDLNGHTRGNRLTAFARKPAPVQATYLGYGATTGVGAIDYRITDAYIDPPPAADELYTEALVRLPGSMWCFVPPPELATGPAPRAAGSSGFTFGSFNNFAKLAPELLELWVQIAARAADARFLLVGVPDGATRERVSGAFSRRGVKAERLAFRTRVAAPDYYALYRDVDVALDSFPYNGGATTCDALWMGVPVLTLTGAGAVERSGLSLLGAAGLGDWATADPGEYVERACAAAAQPARIRELRATLRARLAGSALCDAATFTAGFEAALREMWRTWCRAPSGEGS